MFAHLNSYSMFILGFRSYAMSGLIFLQASDILNRDQLINMTRTSYDREVIKRDGPSTQINVENIKGKCSVLSLKCYCTCTY